ncbi:MAG: PEP-CTERM sorting domain-containing protein [Fimbriimonas sp.]
MTCALALGAPLVAHAQMDISEVSYGVAASASATDGNSLNYGTSSSHSSSVIGNYNKLRGVGLVLDPFYAYPTGRAKATLSPYTITFSGESQANVNTNGVDSMPSPFLSAYGGASSSATFTVQNTASYHLAASMYRYDSGGGGAIELTEDGVTIASIDPYYGNFSADYELSPGKVYTLSAYASTSVSTSNSYSFRAGTLGYDVSISTVPEPVTVLLLGPAVLAVMRRRRSV